MGFLSAYEGNVTVDLSELVGAPADTWTVTVRKSLSNKDLMAAKRFLSRIENGQAQPDVASYQLEMVIASVIDWNLTDAKDADLPLWPADRKRASISNLPEAVFSRILAAVRAFNREPTEEEENSFRDEGSDGPASGEDEVPAAGPLPDALPRLAEDGSDA